MHRDKVKFFAIFACAAACLIVLVGGMYVANFSPHLSQSQEKWGQFGDYFGGILNPLLSFCALLGLLMTLRSQQQESYKAERRHAAMTFDTRLFQLLSLSHDAVASIKFVQQGLVMRQNTEYEGHRAVAYALNRLQEDYLNKVERVEDEFMYQALRPAFLGWKTKYWPGVASYIESMLFLMVYAIEKAGSSESSQFALRAIFAQMSADEKLLIFYVMIFELKSKIILQGDVSQEFLDGASQDDLLLIRQILLHSAVQARIRAGKI